jgi:tetratricopeptide (TPR) repeat protein
MVYLEAGNYTEAERAYRQGLMLRVRYNLRRDEGSSLSELGRLYETMERLEEAVTFYRQASDVAMETKDLAKEGLRRNNLGSTLIKLQHYDEARRELLRAIECKMPYGHAAKPWTSWSLLEDLENAVGDEAAAAQAREKSRAAYLAYRREGGLRPAWLGRRVWNYGGRFEGWVIAIARVIARAARRR